MVWATVIAYLVGYVTSLFIPVNFAWISIGIVVLSVCYLFFLSIKHWVKHYALIALFALGSLAFMFSVDYVFTDILEPHQQVRIR